MILIFIIKMESLEKVLNMGRKKNRKKQKEEKEQAYPLVPFLFAGMLIGIWIGG